MHAHRHKVPFTWTHTLTRAETRIAHDVAKLFPGHLVRYQQLVTALRKVLFHTTPLHVLRMATAARQVRLTDGLT
jgi:hypothetical protein